MGEESVAHFVVGTTPAELPLPAGLSAAVVVNSGETAVVIDNRDDVSLNPQSGIRLAPGDVMTFPAYGGNSLQLWAVAAGAGQVTAEIFPDDDGVEG
jgi:hypothetical protein